MTVLGSYRSRRPELLLTAASLLYSLALLFGCGPYPGANYDSYQYVYAAMRAARLPARELAEFSRLHVHSGYFPLWQLFDRWGLPVWAATSGLSILCTAATVGLLYRLARVLGCSHRFALMAALIWQSFGTVAFYGNIPEVYAPWMLCLVLTLLALEQQRDWLAAGCFGLATWSFLQSLLLWPAFLLVKRRRASAAGGLGLALGIGLHLVTLAGYGIPFLARLGSERVYWQVATGWSWFIGSTWKSLDESGMLWVLLGCCLLWWRQRGSLPAAGRRLLLLAGPLLVAPALWVKDHGSFFLPLGMVLSLLCPLLLERRVAGRRWQSGLVLTVLLLFCASNFRASWQAVAYDRAMGRTQVSYCRQAVIGLPPDSQVLSTALLSTWLWTKEAVGRSDVQCLYFPWLLRSDYQATIDRGVQELRQEPGIYYVDQTVTEAVLAAGELLERRQILVPCWPIGQASWDLNTVYLGER